MFAASVRLVGRRPPPTRNVWPGALLTTAAFFVCMISSAARETAPPHDGADASTAQGATHFAADVPISSIHSGWAGGQGPAVEDLRLGAVPADDVELVYFEEDGGDSETGPSSRYRRDYVNLRHVSEAADGDGAADASSCTLEDDQIARFLRRNTRAWIVGDEVIEEILSDLQQLVDCTRAGDVVFFNVTGQIRPASGVDVRWNLTLNGNAEDSEAAEGVSSEPIKQQRITCPGGDEGVFRLSGRQVVLANLRFEGCELQSAAVVEVAPCSGSDLPTSISLHRVTFGDNVLDGSSAFSAAEAFCSRIEMEDVEFRSNVCSSQGCGARLSSSAFLHRINATHNRYPEATPAPASVLSISRGSAAVVRGLHATENNVTVVQIRDASLELAEGHFVQNKALLSEDAAAEMEENFAASTSVSSSDPLRYVTNPSNAGVSVGATNSTLRVRSSTFAKNSAFFGPAILSLEASNVAIHNCSFSENNAGCGGAVFLFRANASVYDSRFLRNSALQGGGSAALYASVLTLRYTTFIESPMPAGGAPDSFRRETFKSAATRKGNGAGGLVYADGSSVRIDHSDFINGSARSYGGLLYFRRSNLNVSSSSFSNGSAASGGIWSLSDSNVTISQSRLSNGSSDGDGGLVDISSSNVTISQSRLSNGSSAGEGGLVDISSSNVTISQSRLSNGSSAGDGGLVRVWSSKVTISQSRLSKGSSAGEGGLVDISSSNVTISQSRLSKGSSNEISGGGGLVNVWSSKVNISDSRLWNGSSDGDGGLVHVWSSKVTTSQSQLWNGISGGGGLVNVWSSKVTISDSRLWNGSAGGGGLLAAGGANVVVVESALSDGSARRHGGGIFAGDDSTIRLLRVKTSNCTANGIGGAVCVKESRLHSVDSNFSECSSKKGGAVGLNATGGIPTVGQFTGNLFRDNSADFGGKMRLVSSENDFLQVAGALFFVSDDVPLCSEDAANCSRLVLEGTDFEGNVASVSGGALFCGSRMTLDKTYLDCSVASALGRERIYGLQELASWTNPTSLENLCASWKNNTAAQSGTNIGTYAVGVMKTVVLAAASETVVTRNDSYVVEDYRSGSELPSIELRFEDALGQVHSPVRPDNLGRATLGCSKGLRAATAITELGDGRGHVEGVVGHGSTGVHECNLTFSDARLKPFKLVLNITDCKIGEKLSASDNQTCEQCSETTYNFAPMESEFCLPCPSNANCSFHAILPERGYWHKTPCSVHLQKCLRAAGCGFGGREEDLEEAVRNVARCDLEETTLELYSRAQCREGYAGPLCGSCEASYGKSGAYRCQTCFSAYGSAAMVLASGLIVAVLSGIAMRSSLKSAVDTLLRRSNAFRLRSRRTLSDAGADVELTPGQATASHTGAELLAAEVDPVPEIVEEPSVPTAAARFTDTMEDEGTKLAEMFKIVVNYAQVLAIAVNVNTQWTSSLLAAFDAAGFVGGVTSDAVSLSVDCAVSGRERIERAVVAVLVDALTPFAVFALFVLYWTVVWMKRGSHFSFWAKRVALSAAAVTYITYISLTKTALSILTCVAVHDSVDHGEDHVARLWAVDTSVECLKGPHLLLALGGGLPLLVVFTVAFPVGLSVLTRKHADVEKRIGWIYEVAGFTYRAQRQKYVYWEAVVMLRKAILAAVVVFAYPLGPNLQVALALYVLGFALFLQTSCRPYDEKFEALNRMESLSIFVSLLTFASSSFFYDERVSEELCLLATVGVTGINALLVSYFAACFFSVGVSYMKAVMQQDGVDFDCDAGALSALHAFFLRYVPSVAHKQLIELSNFIKKRGGEDSARILDADVETLSEAA